MICRRLGPPGEDFVMVPGARHGPNVYPLDLNVWRLLDWRTLGSTECDGTKVINNHTPLTLPPYAGIEVRITAYGRSPIPRELPVKIRLRDMFGKAYDLEVRAKPGGGWQTSIAWGYPFCGALRDYTGVGQSGGRGRTTVFTSFAERKP